MPEGRVRRARLSDIPELLALEAYFPTDRLNRANLRHLLARGHADVLVYEQARRVLGDIVLLYRRGSRAARLYSLVTHPAHRGYGIGSRLLAAGESAARRHGCDRIHLEVRPGNRPALRLYRTLGYTVTGRRARFYEDGVDAQRLEKQLAAR